MPVKFRDGYGREFWQPETPEGLRLYRKYTFDLLFAKREWADVTRYVTSTGTYSRVLYRSERRALAVKARVLKTRERNEKLTVREVIDGS